MQKPRKKSAPATKDDIKQLMESIGRVYDANQRWANEIVRHFDVTVETIRHDLLGANKDRIEDHEDRITRLERRAGVTLA